MSEPRFLTHIQTLPSWLAGRVADRGRELVAAAIAAEGLKLPQHAVLAAVAECGPIAQADLVRLLRFDPKDMVVLINHLEHAGLAARRPDPHDRRKNAVTATSRGLEVLDRCARLAEDANAELLASLTDAETRQLMQLMDRVHRG
ncbi:MarR family winged helix-turn-helix transcriptional regulator [Nocardia stercoris]|uniref:MarR family transcriptional regulator n=1 Tax=Nocardia stercoris TaxID=2483361 RepID=A0A3M2LFL8_9NOCA|nr:MarR family transcriptional regulator [Nocardia stercoris]RMI33498.1 MarR family transcriptional regulator [Nocardia stercoris]